MTDDGRTQDGIRSVEITAEDRRRAIEAARRSIEPQFYLTEGQISHIRKQERAAQLALARSRRRR